MVKFWTNGLASQESNSRFPLKLILTLVLLCYALVVLTTATLTLVSASMSPPTFGTARARELVNQIVQKNGFVRESSLDTMSQEVRREVEQALLAKDKKIGSSVLTYDVPRSPFHQ